MDGSLLCDTDFRLASFAVAYQTWQVASVCILRVTVRTSGFYVFIFSGHHIEKIPFCQQQQQHFFFPFLRAVLGERTLHLRDDLKSAKQVT